jgi:hypothetical protein
MSRCVPGGGVTFKIACTFFCVFFVVLCLACGMGKKPPPKRPASEILPVHIASTGWIRDPEIDRFAGDSLFEYIDGAAEMYHKYRFIEVKVAEYRKEESTITADAYRFADSDRAFGMYTTLRPEEPDTIMLGVEGFAFGANLVFVKGAYVVNVYGYEESEEMISAVKSIAATIASVLPGTMEKPKTFEIFPLNGRLPFTEKIYAESFLGHGFLTDVYTVNYSRDGGHFTLFVSEDPTSAKLDQWSQNVVGRDDTVTSYQHLPFEGAKYLLTIDPYHGEILAGAQAGRLLGIVGHRRVYDDVMVEWLNSLLDSVGD